MWVLNGLALCAGIGGLELGLRLALPRVYRCVGYVERDAYAAAILVARMADSALDQAPIWDCLETFDGRPWRGKVDIVTGGYPCQPFSFAGRRGGAADARHLWPRIRTIIQTIEPGWCFFENVSGHVSMGLGEVCEDLEGLGFRVAAGLFGAGEMGAPHKRERLFVLAHADGVGCETERGGGVLHGERKAQRHDSNRRDGAGVPVGDTDREGLEGRRMPEPESSDERPTWPPGPEGDWETWGGPQPAICRADDGATYRVDRLRALGNAVVPVVAARAFSTLVGALADSR